MTTRGRKAKNPLTKLAGVQEVDELPITEDDASDSEVKVILVDTKGVIGIVVRRGGYELWQRNQHTSAGKDNFGNKYKKGDFTGWRTSQAKYFSSIEHMFKECWRIALRNRLSEDDINNIKDVLKVVENSMELLDADLFEFLKKNR